MTALTTRQRDLLRLLLDANAPLVTASVAQQLQLTPRQVNYSLKGVKRWLTQHDAKLSVTPGIGVQLICNTFQSQALSHALQSDDSYQLVLSPSQRQQLFLFHLITTDEPLILYQLQQRTRVSRTTILKDLDSAEPWINKLHLRLERRPNYGIEIIGDEKAKRQALVALLWGDSTNGDALWNMTHTDGLTFDLNDDASLLPILLQIKEVVDEIEAHRAIEHVAQAEAALGGRFSDVAVLHLALVFAVQRQRVKRGYHLVGADNSAEINQLKAHPIWPTASRIYAKLLMKRHDKQHDAEVASIAAHLLGGARNDRWPGDLESETDFSDLISALMAQISEAYRLPDLLQDSTLRDGLISHVIPACLRQKYKLWSPPQYSNRLQDTYAFEHTLSNKLGELIAQQTGATLPDNETNNLALLIRAAYVRERPNRLQHVIVVCPSGMATAQLLTARLKARFPRLGKIEVLSMRELNVERVDSAELVLTTVPLPTKLVGDIKVIKVHPLLLPEDIETITQWLA
ncbi:MAG: BglG family transcription antiterminator [Candidatus Promineifilaceae bacterium]